MMAQDSNDDATGCLIGVCVTNGAMQVQMHNSMTEDPFTT